MSSSSRPLVGAAPRCPALPPAHPFHLAASAFDNNASSWDTVKSTAHHRSVLRDNRLLCTWRRWGKAVSPLIKQALIIVNGFTFQVGFRGTGSAALSSNVKRQNNLQHPPLLHNDVILRWKPMLNSQKYSHTREQHVDWGCVLVCNAPCTRCWRHRLTSSCTCVHMLPNRRGAAIVGMERQSAARRPTSSRIKQATKRC